MKPARPAAPVPGPHDTLTDVEGLSVGHATVTGGGSGCTVVLGPFRARVEVAGFASGTRELPTLEAGHAVSRADALLLSGGSAFGLAAADGVMQWMESEGRGFETGVAPVPIVPAAVLFDLAPGRARPGPEEGRRACAAAHAGPVEQGRVGAGAGARVGKLLGMDRASPGGLGSASLRIGGWTVGALAVVNALGDILGLDGRVVAGARPEREGGSPPDGTAALLAAGMEGEFSALSEGANTTLCVVATDAPLGGGDLTRVVRIAATAVPRRISPAHTPFDGDVVFALATEEEERRFSSGAVLTLAVAAREALERAILRAVGVGGPGEERGARAG